LALLTLRNISLAFGGPPILEELSLQIEAGDRLCLLGRNGAGKSTLLQVIAGELLPESGEVTRQPGLRVARLSQDVPADLTGTVFDVVATGLGAAATALAEYHHASHAFAETPTDALLTRMERLQKTLEDTGGWGVHQEVGRLLSRLTLEAEAEFPALSGGTKRRVLLARALVGAPDILLLDEPTNQLDIDTILWLEEFLLHEVKTSLFVTHDRALARRLANRVAELDRGRLYAFGCGYDLFVERREALLEAEVTRRAAFDRKLAQEEAWIRQGIKARRTRNEGRVRALQEMRDERRQRRERTGQVKLQLSTAENSGRLVVEARGVSAGYGERTVLRDLTTTIMQGDKVGIIGPNGAGKTTLLRLLAGGLKPREGTLRFGRGLEVLYFDQLREELDLDRSVRENVGDGGDTVTIDGRPRHVLGYLQDFLFSPERAATPVRVLSGGERNRLLLARLFARPCNVLVMDEPTNDLDTDTLDLLEDLLLAYAGTLLLVSHDRDFLNNAVTSTLVVDAGGNVREYVGGYDDWVRQAAAAAAAGNAAAPAKKTPSKPRRVAERPRKLTFNEARELADLPDRITRLEREQAEIHATLADPEFYRNAGTKASELNARLAAIDQELEAALHRWDELDSLPGS